MSAPKTVDWQDWEDEVFEKARSENKPIFLVISASWCRWCKSMDEMAFSNASVIEIIEKEFVPILVDKDKRPDINERYNMGGWPSCSVLNADGEVVTGGTYFTADQLATLLEKVADACRNRKEKIQDLIDATVREEEEGRDRNFLIPRRSILPSSSTTRQTT